MKNLPGGQGVAVSKLVITDSLNYLSINFLDALVNGANPRKKEEKKKILLKNTEKFIHCFT